jgi:hypothetical protein
MSSAFPGRHQSAEAPIQRSNLLPRWRVWLSRIFFLAPNGGISQ